MPLSQTEYEVLNYVEQEYMLSRHVPSAEVISERLGISVQKIKSLWERADFKAGLTARGIDLRKNSNGVLTAEQLMCANTLLDFADTRSDKKKLQDLGIASQTYQGWLKDPGFANYMMQRAEALFGDLMPDAHRALADNVRRGDLGSIKLYYEMSGRWSSKPVGELNVEFLMMKILETLQKHISDPATISAISDELLGLAANSNPGREVKALPSVAFEL